MHVVFKSKKPRHGWVGFLTGIAAIIFVAIVLSAFIPTAEKTYEVRDTIGGWVKTDRGIEYVKQRVRQSDLPSKEVAFMVDSILIPLQDMISKQVSPAYQLEQKRIQDSVSKTQKPKQ